MIRIILVCCIVSFLVILILTMPTLQRNRDHIQNKVYSSVKLLSTTKAIDDAVNILHNSVGTLSSTNKRKLHTEKNTNSIIRVIQNELRTLSGCNSVLTTEIAPSLVNTGVSSYCHKRIKNSGPNCIQHVDSAMIVTPEKRRPYCNSINRGITLKSPIPKTSGYSLIPIPHNGQIFTPREAMTWLELPVRDTTLHGKIKTMIRLKYVPIGKSRLYTMYKQYLLNGLCSNEWHIAGRLPIVTVTAINKSVEEYQRSTGRSITGKDLGSLLTKSRRAEAYMNGIDESQVQPVHYCTIRNYRMLTAVNSNKKIASKVQQKTENRFIAENSILSTISYLFTVAAAHLLIGVPDPKFNTVMKKHKITKGARMLVQLVSSANDNAPIYNVLPGLITSTDDTTVFVFKGETQELEGWYLVDKNHDNSKQSYFSNDTGGTDNKNGLRVRLTFTLNGVGMMAAPFITVTGITEKELPRNTCPSGVYILSIPGLCSGGNTDVRNDAVGHVAFVRSERGAVSGKTSEQRNFEWYRENVLLPFIKNIRRVLYQHDINTPIPDELSAVAWCDGALTQLASITNESQQIDDAANKISTCKHSAARTAVEQAADCCPIFRSIKKISKSITREDVPHLGLQRIVENEFRRLENKGILKLASKKLGSLIDFISCYPTILSKAAPHNAATARFIDNGMIDAKSYSYPDIDSLVKTCKTTKFTKEILGTISKKFKSMYDEQVKIGHLSDDFMEGYGFKVDLNYVGDEIRRLSTCEAWQRAKCLSSKYQRDLRTRKVNIHALSKITKLAEIQKNLTNMHKQNQKCITQLLSVVSTLVMPRPHPRVPDLSGLTLKEFSSCNKELLHGFIYVREFKNWRMSSKEGFKWPKNKESLEAAKLGNYNYISLAYDVRSKPIILPITSEITTTTEIVEEQNADDLLVLEVPTVVQLNRI